MSLAYARPPPLLVATLLVLSLFASALPAKQGDEPYRVLVVHSHQSNLPVNSDWYNAIARGLASAPELDIEIEIEVEAPDLTRVADAEYVDELIRTYSHKYRGHMPARTCVPHAEVVDIPYTVPASLDFG